MFSCISQTIWVKISYPGISLERRELELSFDTNPNGVSDFIVADMDTLKRGQIYLIALVVHYDTLCEGSGNILSPFGKPTEAWGEDARDVRVGIYIAQRLSKTFKICPGHLSSLYKQLLLSTFADSDWETKELLTSWGASTESLIN